MSKQKVTQTGSPSPIKSDGTIVPWSTDKYTVNDTDRYSSYFDSKNIVLCETDSDDKEVCMVELRVNSAPELVYLKSSSKGCKLIKTAQAKIDIKGTFVALHFKGTNLNRDGPNKNITEVRNRFIPKNF